MLHRPSPCRSGTAPPFCCITLAILVPLLIQAALPGPTQLIWRHDPDPDAVLSVSDGRPSLLYFTASWCGPCRLLEQEVFTHSAGLAELRHYQLVRLDLDSTNGRALADRYQVQSVPTFLMLTGRGELIERLTGYRSRRLLLRNLASFRQGHGTLEDLQQRLGAQPGNHSLRLELGLRHDDRQEIPEAIEQLSSGLAALHAASTTSCPSFAASCSVKPAVFDTVVTEASRSLAQIHHREGRPQQAVLILEQLLDTWPTHPYPRVTWLLLADCHRANGNAVAAAAALLEAASISPQRADLLDSFAAAAMDIRWNLDTAETAARQAVAMTDRNNPRFMVTLAQVLRHRRRYAEALLWIKRAEAASPDDARWQDQRQEILRAAIAGD